MTFFTYASQLSTLFPNLIKKNKNIFKFKNWIFEPHIFFYGIAIIQNQAKDIIKSNTTSTIYERIQLKKRELCDKKKAEKRVGHLILDLRKKDLNI
jgi:hypothetical protein